MNDTFQLKTRTASVSYSSESEKNAVNASITQISEIAGRPFSSFREVFEFCLQFSIDQNTENVIENTKTDVENVENTIENQLEAAISSCNQLETERNHFENKVESLESELESIRNQPVIEPKTIEIEVIKEVPAPLSENQLLLDLHPSQVLILKMISERRFQNKNDKELNTPAKQVVDIVFNKQTLFNWAGNYPTHLELKEFRNQ